VAIDFDRDGDLDLLGCMYARSKKYHYENRTLPLPVPYHDANNGSRNILYRNDGSWNFTDVTTEVGLDQNNSNDFNHSKNAILEWKNNFRLNKNNELLAGIALENEQFNASNYGLNIHTFLQL